MFDEISDFIFDGILDAWNTLVAWVKEMLQAFMDFWDTYISSHVQTVYRTLVREGMIIWSYTYTFAHNIWRKLVGPGETIVNKDQLPPCLLTMEEGVEKHVNDKEYAQLKARLSY